MVSPKLAEYRPRQKPTQAEIDADDSAAVADALARVAAGETTVPGEVVVAIARGKHPIAAWRNHRNLNQSELGKRAKLNASHISQIENGARNASVPTLVVLGKALDVPWNWLSPAR
jgi:DNA-binding XRE family transcriptional regulator